MTPRAALAARLATVAGGVPVRQVPLRQAAPPVYAIAPGTPYLRPSSAVPGCLEDWRVDVWCITTREDVVAMDTQDAMVADVRAAAAADGDGFVVSFLGVDRANIDTTDLAGMPGLATIAQLRLSATPAIATPAAEP
jgi:hypothetical protein